MHVLQPRKPKHTVTGKLDTATATRIGHLSQRRDWYQDRRTKRHRTRADQNRAALAG